MGNNRTRHGGSDPGATGNGIIEKDLALKISDYMLNRFKQLGIPVTLIRTDDKTIDPTTRVKRILDAYGNNKDVIVISNHINAGGGDGAEVIYALRNNNKLANMILEELNIEGQNIRKAYQRRLPSDTSKDYYFIHRLTGNTEPVIIEYGFLDSSSDDVGQLKNNYEKYAEAVVRAVTNYIDKSYVPLPGSNYYVVQTGDSLWSISKKYGVTIEELKAANNLTSNLLNLGQTLRIPVMNEPISGEYITYIVQKGDSLYSISKKYNLVADSLIDYNNLSSSNLSIGQKILIPTTTKKEEAILTKYIVKPGDTLYSIARKYGINISDIMISNDLSTNNLSIGQVLIIPAKEKEKVYTVMSGDSLYSIAKKLNTSIESIKQKNSLTSNTLSIGQILII